MGEIADGVDGYHRGCVLAPVIETTGWQFQTCSNRLGVYEPNSFGLRMRDADFNPWRVGWMKARVLDE